MYNPPVLNSLKNFTTGLTRTRQTVFGRVANIIGVSEIKNEPNYDAALAALQAC